MAGKLIIDFGSDKVADHFIRWLSGAGEQDYWNWMEYREMEEQGTIPMTAIRFDYCEYRPGTDGSWHIKTTNGRLDTEEAQ